MQDTALSRDQLGDMAEMFRLLADPSRLSIVLTVAAAPKSVTAVADSTGLSQSLVSHHLRLLRSARIVRAQRQGRVMEYSLADACVSQLLAIMVHHVREG